jgi:nucleotide-binding universal stress UspA family protein
MFKHILVPIDFSKYAINAVETAVDLAKIVGAKVELLNIITMDIAVRKNQAGEYESVKESAKEFIGHVIQTAEDRLDKFKKEAQNRLGEGAKLEIFTTVLVAEDSKTIVESIIENDFDLLIIGGKREDKLVDIFDVPIREKVIQLANCPVLIVNEKIESFKIEHIVFATQFRKGAEKVAKDIRQLMEIFGAKCTLLYVVTQVNFKTTEEVEERAQKFMLTNQLENCELCIYNDRKIESGIMRFSDRTGADLTIVCTESSRWSKRFFRGEFTNEIATHSAKPVLTYNLSKID